MWSEHKTARCCAISATRLVAARRMIGRLRLYPGNVASQSFPGQAPAAKHDRFVQFRPRGGLRPGCASLFPAALRGCGVCPPGLCPPGWRLPPAGGGCRSVRRPGRSGPRRPWVRRRGPSSGGLGLPAYGARSGPARPVGIVAPALAGALRLPGRLPPPPLPWVVSLAYHRPPGLRARPPGLRPCPPLRRGLGAAASGGGALPCLGGLRPGAARPGGTVRSVPAPSGLLPRGSACGRGSPPPVPLRGSVALGLHQGVPRTPGATLLRKVFPGGLTKGRKCAIIEAWRRDFVVPPEIG